VACFGDYDLVRLEPPDEHVLLDRLKHMDYAAWRRPPRGPAFVVVGKTVEFEPLHGVACLPLRESLNKQHDEVHGQVHLNAPHIFEECRPGGAGQEFAITGSLPQERRQPVAESLEGERVAHPGAARGTQRRILTSPPPRRDRLLSSRRRVVWQEPAAGEAPRR
jgi:hypothetical protein